MKLFVRLSTLIVLMSASLLAKENKLTETKKETIKKEAAKETIVCIETTQGIIEVKLYPDVAPKACENFITLVEKKYYDGIIFHRVIKDFMLQTGDPQGNGTGGQSCWGKPFEDEFKSGVAFDKEGMLAMANAGPGTNGSQFFITTVKTPWLNNRHTIFGEVIKGYDIVKKIEKQETDFRDKPKSEQKIIKAYIKK